LGRGQPLGEASLRQSMLDPGPLGRVASQTGVAAKFAAQEGQFVFEAGDVFERLMVERRVAL
jgi:hypothetical protein